MQQRNTQHPARRYTGDELFRLVQQVKAGKEKRRSQKVEAKCEPKYYPEVGSFYRVTKTWDDFWSYYKVAFVATEQVYHFLGQQVKVLKIDGDSVRVSFTNHLLGESWVPTQVLRNQLGQALKPFVDVKRADFDDLARQKIKLKNESLRADNSDLQVELVCGEQKKRQLMEEVRLLKDRVAVLEESHKFEVEEKKEMASQIDHANQRNLTLETENVHLRDRLDFLRTTTVKKSIESLPELIENCTISQLNNATKTIQKEIQIREEEHLRRQKRLEDQIQGYENQNNCIICYEQPRNHMFTPCFHFCACESCATRMEGDLSQGNCPICRQRIESIIPVYNV